jgi:hypothetical protein
MSFLGIGKKSTPQPLELIESVWGNRISVGGKPSSGSEQNSVEQTSHLTKPAPAQSNPATARELVEEASRRVADLEGRLSGKREKASQLAAQLNALQEAAVEAAVRGEEPTSFTALETALRDAQAAEHILEQALNRATVSLKTVETESRQALQAEQDENFAKTLREFTQAAAKVAECQGRLSEIQKASGGRYSSSLLWSAFSPDNDYAQWRRNAEDFLNRPRAEKGEPAAANADGDHSQAGTTTGNGNAANDHQVEEVYTNGEAGRALVGNSHA